jgi:hypothetical protein
VAHGDAVEVQAEQLLQTAAVSYAVAAAAGATAGSDSNVAIAPAAATVAATAATGAAVPTVAADKTVFAGVFVAAATAAAGGRRGGTTIITVKTDPSQKCWLARQPRRRAVMHTCAPPYSLALPTQAPIRIRTTMRVPVEGGNSNRLPI